MPVFKAFAVVAVVAVVADVALVAVAAFPLIPMPQVPVAPEPLVEGTSKARRAPDAVAAPVPPFVKASVPPSVIVPDPVIGPPDVVRPVVPPLTATDVTVPPPDVEAIVIDPLPLVILMPEPAVNVALVSVLPVLLPISSSPSVYDVCPVPPLATGSAVPERETASVPDVVMGLPETERKDGTDIATLVTEPEPPRHRASRL